MEKINVELSTINQISEEFIKNIVDKDVSIIKVTTETYYAPYKGDDDKLTELVTEWFDKYGNSSHAYRDGSKIHFTNLLKVEILK